MQRFRRALSCAAVVALGTVTAVTASAQPAQAMNYTSAGLSAWTYTDSAQPTTPKPNPSGDALIGTSQDAAHTGRAYFTYDLTRYQSQVLHQANLFSYESKVNDCGTAAPIQVWRTRPVTASTTWRKPPKELELVAERNLGKGILCPGAYLGIDVLPQLQAAIARRERTITFEVRVAPSGESDAKAGRRMKQFGLSVWANHVPTVSGMGLLYPDRRCGTLTKHPTAGNNTYFTAVSADADPGSYPKTYFAIWPVEHPDQRKEFGGQSGTVRTSRDLREYPDGTLLAWAAQGRDDDDEGAWSKTCYLTVDNTAPTAAPKVSGKKYTEDKYPGTGGPGVAGRFLLDALGDQDVVAFEYQERNQHALLTAKANHPGGRARVSVTPNTWGPQELRVRSVDAAGNRGPWAEFEFYVRNTAPFGEVDVAGVGLPSRITLRSSATEVTAFGYAVDGGPEVRVPAVNGVGTGEIVFGSTGNKTIVERAYAGRKMIGSHTQQVYVSDTPGIASDEFNWMTDPIAGAPGTFTFTPRTTGVVAYLYDFGDGDQKRIEARPDGTAVLPWTPATGGYFTISVVSVTADGTQSASAQESFRVIDTHPAVSYDRCTSSPDLCGVGRPVTVSLSSDLPGVTGFVYSFDGGPEKTTTDGQNTWVEVIPTHAGDSAFTARAKLADGTLSPPTTIQIHITSGPLVSVKGPYGESAVLGRPATFTFKPAVPAVASYRYWWGYFPENEQTVAAAADGSATMTWTADSASYTVLSVVSIAADGTESDVRKYAFLVDDPAVGITASWDQYSPSGGMGLPGRIGFHGDLIGNTVTYMWRVADGPVQEVTPTPEAAVTYVPYTPTAPGPVTVHVQRKFTDGTLSPMAELTMLVGTEPKIESDIYPAGGWGGGPGQAGTFRFSGGMPGIVAWEYSVSDYSEGEQSQSGTIDADGTGAAELRFTPKLSKLYYLRVTGRTADGTVTDSAQYGFSVK